MNALTRLLRKSVLTLAAIILTVLQARAQFADCSTGLLQMPTAEMQKDPTFMLTNNFLNKHSLPTKGWSYNTFQYGIGVSFWGRVEMSYVCTILNDHWKGSQSRKDVWMINQDRHFTGRICLLREGDFGLKWMPALVVGVSDPFTGNSGGEYIGSKVDGSVVNGYFNRNFAILTKHLSTKWGPIGLHLGYQFNQRKDYFINAPCAAIDWRPVWAQNRGVIDELDLILEYDSRTVNCGLIASIWKNHFEAMFELQNFRWINCGLRYKLRLKR